MEVTILNRQRHRRVSTRALSAFVARLAKRLPPEKGDRIAVVLVSDERMRRYNRIFRDTDRPTDVLAFEGGGTAAPEGGRHLGDIVISVPRASDQARRAGHSVTREIRILVIHGYLHLLGFDHDADDGTMMRVQRRLVRALARRTARETA